MRVRVEGDCPTAAEVRGLLQTNDYHLVGGEAPSSYTLYVSERRGIAWPVLEGIEGPMLNAAVKRVGELVPSGALTIIFKGHSRGDRQLGVIVPMEDQERAGVARAVLRTMNDLRKVEAGVRGAKRPWWRFGLGLLAGLLLFPAPARAQNRYWPVTFVTSTGSVIWAGDAVNNAVRVNVVASTGGGGGLTDAELRATPVPVSGSGNFAVTGTFWQVTQPVSGTFWQATQPVSGTFWQATQPVSGPLTDAQLRAVAVPVSGPFFQATQPVSIAASVTVTDGSGALNVIVDSGAITANVPSGLDVDVLTLPALVAGSANIGDVDVLTIAAGNNNIGDVDVASLPNVTIGTFPDNEPFNLAQVAGVATAVGNGTAAGAVRVALPTDGTGVVGLIAGSATVGSIASITTSVVPGVAATNLGKAEDAPHTTADTGVPVWGVRTDPTTTAFGAANDYTPVGLDYVGAHYEGAHPGRFSCFVALTATATTQCQAAAAAGLRNYVTGLVCSNGAATVQGVDIVYGTGAACVTGLTAISHKFQMGTNQLTTSPFIVSVQFGENTPLVPAAAAAICTRPTAATAYGCTITGYVAP